MSLARRPLRRRLEQATPLSVRAALPPRVVKTIVEKEWRNRGLAIRSAQCRREENVVETIVEKAVEKPVPVVRSAHPSEERNLKR